MSADDTQPSPRIAVAPPRFARVPLGFVVTSLLLGATIISCMIVSLVLVAIGSGAY